MKPVAIFRHTSSEGPGYLATYLHARGIPLILVRVDRGDPVPPTPADFSGLVFMGGPMSVNDDLPWIPPILALIRAAVARDVPVLGHCLGGQLMSRALGGVVRKNPVKEIGWGEVEAVPGEAAGAWLGEDFKRREVFHWHGETFTVPEGATRILKSRFCENQAYVLGRHLGLQCHVEMTPSMISEWCRQGEAEIAENLGPSVQSAADMQAQIPAKLPGLHRVADTLYDRWLSGVTPA